MVFPGQRQRALLQVVAQPPIAGALVCGALRAQRHEARHDTEGAEGRKGQRLEQANGGGERHEPRQAHRPGALEGKDVGRKRQKRRERGQDERRRQVGARNAEAHGRGGGHIEAARQRHSGQQRDDMRARKPRRRQKQQAERREDDLVNNAFHGRQYTPFAREERGWRKRGQPQVASRRPHP